MWLSWFYCLPRNWNMQHLKKKNKNKCHWVAWSQIYLLFADWKKKNTRKVQICVITDVPVMHKRHPIRWPFGFSCGCLLIKFHTPLIQIYLMTTHRLPTIMSNINCANMIRTDDKLHYIAKRWTEEKKNRHRNEANCVCCAKWSEIVSDDFERWLPSQGFE